MPKRPATALTPFQAHKEKWKNGCGNGICEGAVNVCLARGRVPCEVLFIGEAPGESEDVIGLPFVGPAGRISPYSLEAMIRKALESAERSWTWCMANVVGCIPRDGLAKAEAPTEDEAKQCRTRLIEFVRICNPKVIVLVGDVAKRFFPKDKELGKKIPKVSIKHPAAILRGEPARKPLDFRTAVRELKRAALEHL